MAFITVKVTCNPELTDLLIAELFGLGFDSFQEFDDGFEGSCEEHLFDEVGTEEILKQFAS